MSTDRKFPPGAVALILLGLLLAAGALAVSLLARGCAPEPVQMIPSPVPAATSTAIASSSAQATGIGRLRVIIPRKPALDVAPQARRSAAPGRSILPAGLSPEPSQRPGKAVSVEPSNGADSGDIVIEFEQVLTTAATSSAQASASASTQNDINNAAATGVIGVKSSYGAVGVIIAAGLPGILAADLQLVRIDVSPVTRWLVSVDEMELGLDVAGNLDAGALGLSAGGKAFFGVYGWSKWDMGAQGVAVGCGLRF